jgi:saccharopine dehydrogenase-like NADP-dependent oxidoreductase
MRAVVLGGGGLTGRGAVRQLAHGGVFESVVAADVDRELAAAAAAAAGPRASVASLDVRDRAATAGLLRGAAVVVNATPYAFNLDAMGAALDARVPYLDFGGLFHTTRRQLELDPSFRQAGLLAIPGLGQVPGVSNVLAMAAAEPLDHVDSIVLRDGWRDLRAGGPELSFTWSPVTFLEEMVRPAVVFEEGAYREHPPMSAAEEFDFAPPVGRTTVYRTLHSEPATLPESLKAKGLRHCEWKEGGPGIELLRTLAQLGLGSETPVDLHGVPVVPRDFLLALLRRQNLLGPPTGSVVDDWEVLDIELRGTEGGQPVVRHARARFPPWPEWHLAATEYAVGTAGAIGAEMIARGEVSGAGVVPPERCVPAPAFRRELARRGIETAVTPPEPPLATPRGRTE